MNRRCIMAFTAAIVALVIIVTVAAAHDLLAWACGRREA